jgi:hypothetical protein
MIRCSLSIAAALLFSTCLGRAVVGQTVDAHDTAAQVDQLLRSEIAAAASVPRSDDETFLRRVFLDLIGEPPTVEDVLAFTLDPTPGKRGTIVNTLLAERAFGKNMARYWRDVIMYRRTEPRALVAADSLTEFLSDGFHNNTPWNEIVREFITATGDVRENGATALIMAQSGMPEDVVSEISRIFIGIQIQCAQCHDHPTDRWQREQFHQLAAFFPRVAIRPTRDGEERSFTVNVNDRRFNRKRRNNNNNRFAGTAEHYMPDLDDPSSRGTMMQPVFFLNDAQVALGTQDAERRGDLADWITSPDNPWFAKAFVNRVWAELVGEGFYEPVDDMGPDRECLTPKTIDYLAGTFVKSGYNVKWLYRTVMASGAYQSQSRSRRNYDEDPFSAACPQRLRADQLFDALTAALDFPEQVTRSNRGGTYGRGRGPRALFNGIFGYDPSEPREEVSSSIPQALALMNGNFINQSINARRPDGLGAILRNYSSDRDALTEVYLKTLSRGPTATELTTCLAYIRRVDDRNEAFEDIQWALINSTEFSHRK